LTSPYIVSTWVIPFPIGGGVTGPGSGGAEPVACEDPGTDKEKETTVSTAKIKMVKFFILYPPFNEPDVYFIIIYIWH